MKNTRLHKTQQLLVTKKAGSFLVSQFHNIYYLTQFRGLSPHEREAYVLVTQEKCFLIIPEMYREQAVATVDQSYVTLVVDSERDGLLSLALKQIKSSLPLLIEEQDVSALEYERIRYSVKVAVAFSEGCIENQRAVKDETELEMIQRAVQITDALYSKSVEYLKKKRDSLPTESEMADIMRRWVVEMGGEGFGFDPIISNGSGSSQPHYRTGNNRMSTGPLLMDFGAVFGGYTGDLTRTIYIGKPQENFITMYNLVLECNHLCIEACKPGIPAASLHARAVDFFQKHGVASHFIHGLGHGVGLDIHEEPFFRSGQETLLQPGMIITIEPGLYFPGEFGIRIEDYVLITENGSQVLSTSPKQLLTL